MKGKKWLAKLFAIAVLSSASIGIAYAEKVRVYEGPYKATAKYSSSTKAIEGSADEICEQLIAYDNAHRGGGYKYTNKVLIASTVAFEYYSWEGGRNPGWISCGISYPPDHTHTSSMGVYGNCDKGGTYSDDYSGCYSEFTGNVPENCENKTVMDDGTVICGKPISEPECPEGQVKDGEQCLDECELAEKNGTPLPEGCPQCPDEPPKSPHGKVTGAVACNGTHSKICTYVDTPYYFGGSYWSKTAKGIATRCIEAHEREHKNDLTLACSKSGWLGFFGEEAQHKGEIAAYKKGEACLREAKEECGWNSICHLEVWGEIANSENSRGRYERK